MEQLTFEELAKEVISNLNYPSKVDYEGGYIRFINNGVSVFLNYDFDDIEVYVVARDAHSKQISCKTILVNRKTIKKLIEYLDKLIISVENINYDFERLETLNNEY